MEKAKAETLYCAVSGDSRLGWEIYEQDSASSKLVGVTSNVLYNVGTALLEWGSIRKIPA